MTKIGYARISTTDQDLSAQKERIRDSGCDVVYSDMTTVGSGRGPARRQGSRFPCC